MLQYSAGKALALTDGSASKISPEKFDLSKHGNRIPFQADDDVRQHMREVS